MSDVMGDDAIIKLLRQMSAALKTNDQSMINGVIEKAGVDCIFSDKAIGLAKAMRDVRLVVFLLTIVEENEFEVNQCSYWLKIYQSINSGVELDKKFNRTTSLLVKSIIEKTVIPNHELNKIKFRDFDLCDLELAFDFRKWEHLHILLKSMPTSGVVLYDWLNFLKLIINRQKYISNDKDKIEITKIYKLIIEKLNGVESIKGSLKLIKLLHANSLGLAGDFDQALAAYRDMPDAKSSPTTMMDMARCHSKIGHYPDAIKQLDELIIFLIHADGNGVKIPTLLETPADLKYTKNNAISAYSDLASFAQIANAKLFMVSGTLLGYARISDFLPNDKDLDFGLIGLDALPALVDLALKSGIFHINFEYLKGKDTIQVPFIHVATGVWIDVFIYHDVGDKFVTGVDFQFGYRQKFGFSKFSPVEVNFHGLKTYVPSNMDENLCENFLTWKEPDVDYISHVESPSILDYGDMSHQMTSRFWLIRAIQAKSSKKLDKVISVLEDISNYPMGIPLDTLNLAKSFATQLQSK